PCYIAAHGRIHGLHALLPRVVPRLFRCGFFPFRYTGMTLDITQEAIQPVYFLLVDKLLPNLQVLETTLQRKGLQTLKAQSGLEALELLLEYDVALALIDVQLPDMDGFSLAEL